MGEKIRILILEDDANDAELMERELRKVNIRFSSKRVETKETFQKELKDFAPDLILADYNLPSFDGISGLKITRKLSPDTPFILVSGAIGEELAIESLKSGATDYVLKQRLSRLGPVVKRALIESEEHAERKQAEEELTKITREWQTTFDSVQDMIMLLDKKFKIIRANRPTLKLFGLSEEEIKGKTCYKLVHGKDAPPKRCPMMKAKKSKKHAESEMYIPENDTWLSVVVDPILDREKKLTKAVHVIRDITESKKAEEDLRVSEEKYRSLVQGVVDAIILVDTKGKVLLVNEATTVLFKKTQSQIIGENLKDLLPEEIAKPRLDSIRRAVETKRPTVHVDWQRGRYLEFIFSPVLNEEGNIVSVTMVARDLTERKQAEEELRESEKQLRHLQKMEAIGRIAGGMAHDFSNLMMAISGFGELVLGQLDERSPLRSDIEEIVDIAGRATALSRQLLAFSRKQVLKLKVLDLNDAIGGMTKMLHRVIGEDIKISTIPEPEIWNVKADLGQIEQVVMNLVINARDAMPEGGKLTITTKNVTIREEDSSVVPEAHPGKFVCLSVADTGVGMDKETIEHAFEPFFTNKVPEEGTGLGLSTTYGIVKQHKGWINVYSETGHGSVFKIYLPAFLLKPEDEDIEEVLLQELKGNAERILLIEDEGSLRRVTARLLSENGYVVFEAVDTKKAMDIFERENGKFDVIFSDVILPDQSGLALVAQLLERKPELKILLSSGYVDLKIHGSTIREKGYHLLEKPYTTETLLRILKEVTNPVII